MLLKVTAKIYPFETDPNMILKVTLRSNISVISPLLDTIVVTLH